MIKTDYTITENKQQVRDLLTQGEVQLTFAKSNGDTRLMRASLSAALLPPAKDVSSPGPPNPDLQVVWDLEAADWRSFKWERLAEVAAK